MNKLFLFLILCLCLVPLALAEDMIGVSSLEDNEVVSVVISFSDDVDLDDVVGDVQDRRFQARQKGNLASRNLGISENNLSRNVVADNLPIFSSSSFEDRFAKIRQQDDVKIPNEVSGKFSKSELEEIMRRYDVDHIEYEREFTVSLDNSVNVIEATNFTNIDFLGSSFNGSNIGVCIMDSGIDKNHSALASRHVEGYDYINGDPDYSDDNGHGTHVAGIIASYDSTYGGVSPGVDLLIYKVINSTGGGSSTILDDAILDCLAYADIYNVKVISMSLGDAGTRSSSTCDGWSANVASAFSAAVAKNISIVISSGNKFDKSGISAPACMTGAISVGATDDSDSIAGFSNSADNLDLLAPGVSVYGPALTSGPTCTGAGGFSSCSGTSMAAPHVSGAIALLQSHYVEFNGVYATPASMLTYLSDGGLNITDTNAITRPRINVYNSYLEMITDFPTFIFTNTTPDNDSSINISDFTIEVNVTDVSDSINGCRLFVNGSEINMTLSGDLCSANVSRSGGYYSYYVYAVDSEGAYSQSDLRYLNISNQAPQIEVNFTSSANTLTNLSCNYSVTDPENDSFNVTLDWFNDGVVQSSLQNLTDVVYTNTSKDQNWTCQIYVEDEMMNVNAVNSSVVVSNSLPVFSLVNQIINEGDLFNYTLNVSDDDDDSITVTTNVSFLLIDNLTIYYQTDYQDSGIYLVQVNVSDGDSSNYEEFNLTINEIEDSDNDGINDSLDVIGGNLSTLNAPNITSIEINGSTNLSENYSGVQRVLFKDANNNTLIEVDWNFSNVLPLNFTVEVVNGKIRVSNFNLQGSTKTLYINKTTSGWNRVCVADQEDVSLSSISSSCNGAGEVKLSCPGTSGSYTCSESNGYFVVSGLSYTSLSAFTQTSSSGGGGGGGGGGGSSSSANVVNAVCVPDWICSQWSSCSAGMQSRECFDGNSCGSSAGAPLFDRSCEMPVVEGTVETTINSVDEVVVGSIVDEPDVVELASPEKESITLVIKEKLQGLEIVNMLFISAAVVILLGALSLISKTSELLRMMRK